MSEEVKKEVKQDNSIQISEDVVANIAGMAIEGIKGIAEMSGGFAGGISEVLSGKKNMAKGIKVDIKEGKAKIEAYFASEEGKESRKRAYERYGLKKKIKEKQIKICNKILVSSSFYGIILNLIFKKVKKII